MDYEEENIIFVPEWCSIMTTGGDFKNRETLKVAMKEANFDVDSDIRLFKISKIQGFLRGMLEYRTRKNLL